jgi:hypothetical protein
MYINPPASPVQGPLIMVVPQATVHAVTLYQEEMKLPSQAGLSLKIMKDLKDPCNILSFSENKVQMMRIEDIQSGVCEETRKFLTWLQQQKYTNIVTKDGTFQGEAVYDYQKKITSLEKEALELKRCIGTLEQNNRSLTGRVETANQAMQTLKTSANSDEMVHAQRIICMEKQIHDHEREKQRYDARFDRQEDLIRYAAATNEQLVTQNATLVRDNAIISRENAALVTENRALSARLTEERRLSVKTTTGDASTSPATAFFTGIMPPFLTEVMKAPAAPIAELASYILGVSKKRRHDDDDRGNAKGRRAGI